MTDQGGDDPHRDDQLLRLVAQVYDEVDAVPDGSTARASVVLSWRDDAAGIAFIVPEAAELLAVRDPDGLAASHRFESPQISIDIAVGDDSLVGAIEPWSGGRVTVEFDGGSASVDVDDRSEFRIARPAARVVRLRLDAVDGASVTTSWFVLTPDRSS